MRPAPCGPPVAPMCGRLAATRSATWSFSLCLRCLPLCLIPPSSLPHSCLPPPALVLLRCSTVPHTSPLWRQSQVCRQQGSLLHAVIRELKALGTSHTVCCAHTQHVCRPSITSLLLINTELFSMLNNNLLTKFLFRFL